MDFFDNIKEQWGENHQENMWKDKKKWPNLSPIPNFKDE